MRVKLFPAAMAYNRFLAAMSVDVLVTIFGAIGVWKIVLDVSEDHRAIAVHANLHLGAAISEQRVEGHIPIGSDRTRVATKFAQ